MFLLPTFKWPLMSYSMFIREQPLEPGYSSIYKAAEEEAITSIGVKPCADFDLGKDYGQLIVEYAETGVEAYRAPLSYLMFGWANPTPSIHDLLAAASALCRIESANARAHQQQEIADEYDRALVDLDGLMGHGFHTRVAAMDRLHISITLKVGECLDLIFVPGRDALQPEECVVVLGGISRSAK